MWYYISTGKTTIVIPNKTERSVKKLLTTKANKIFIDEILQLVTKAFSSITSELMTHPQYWNDEDGKMKKVF